MRCLLRLKREGRERDRRKVLGEGRLGRGDGKEGRETVSGIIVLVFSSFSEASDSVWLWLSCSLVITEERGSERGGEGN